MKLARIDYSDVGAHTLQMGKEDLLATVACYIQQKQHLDSSEDINTLRQRNQKLLEQIQDIELRIRTDPQLAGLDPIETDEGSDITSSRKRPRASTSYTSSDENTRVGYKQPSFRHDSSQIRNRAKRMKVSPETSSSEVQLGPMTQQCVPHYVPVSSHYMANTVPLSYPSPPESIGSDLQESLQGSCYCPAEQHVPNYYSNMDSQTPPIQAELSYGYYYSALPPTSTPNVVLPVAENIPSTTESIGGGCTNNLEALLQQPPEELLSAQDTNWVQEYQQWTIDDLFKEYL